MVRISSKLSNRRIPQKKKSSTKPIGTNSNTTDQPSSKILNVVRQALLNAAEELISQQQDTNENQLNSSISFSRLDNSCQQNENAIKKKKISCKNKKTRRN